MADATYGAKQAPSPDVQFRTDFVAGVHTPYHKDADRAALVAAIAGATANLGLQSTLASIDATLKAQADIAVSLWTDNSGAFYVRRDVIDQDSGTVTVTFTNPTGTAATPGAGLRPVANEESLHTETIRYVSNVSGTGHTAGDMLERVVVMDANASPPTVVSSTWVNLTTGAVMGTAPTIANLTANPTALPANAMTETTGAAILAKLIASPATSAGQDANLAVSNDMKTALNALVLNAETGATVNVAADSAVMKLGNTSVVPKFAKIVASSAGAANEIVAAVADKKIRVLDYMISAAGAVNAKWTTDTSGTPVDISGLHYMGAVGQGAAPGFCPVGLFETAVGKNLGLNLSGAVAVGGWVVYIEV